MLFLFALPDGIIGCQGLAKTCQEWALFSAFILGLNRMGRCLGLRGTEFWSYWAWDPVEKYVVGALIIMVAGLHTNLIARSARSGDWQKPISIIWFLLLMLYSSYLTRWRCPGDTKCACFQTKVWVGNDNLVCRIYRHRYLPVPKRQININPADRR